MTDRAVLAQKLAIRLIRENRCRSWRKIAKEDFPPIVKAGTLNRIANSGGTWIPKDEKLLRALGLIEPLPKWARRIKRRIAKLAKQTRMDLGLQKR
jgi:hypothetical protein